MIAERRARVLGAEDAAPLQLGHDQMTEILERLGIVVADDVEAVGRFLLEPLLHLVGHVPGRAPDPALEYVGGRQAQRLAGAGVLSAKEGKRRLAAATERLRDFHRPALVAWASEDRVMPPEHGRRLAEILPEGRLVEIADSYTLIPLDQPGELAASIRAFMPEEVRTTDRDRVSPTGPGALSVGGRG